MSLDSSKPAPFDGWFDWYLKVHGMAPDGVQQVYLIPLSAPGRRQTHTSPHIPRLPRGLAGLVASLGGVLLVASVYLETNHLAVLQKHPILANLLSGAIGFCFGLLVLSLTLNRLNAHFTAVEESREEARLFRAGEEYIRKHDPTAGANGGVKVVIDPKSHPRQFG